MSMKKALDQTLRDIKRGVNKKVLKVPSVEQNVLDATSNEPWGPHGSLLADIAQASRNYHEYQMIMTILWKRINDIGKNWRHVYKALTVLEYLVAHGAERIIDDIKEHAYQISTLSDFQYIDSSGRDQGNNVRRKSQSLVALVNDKERIIEVRQKAASNRDKFRSSSAVGGMYRPGSGGYGDDRYEGRYGVRDDDRNGYGREREWSYRDDERYGRYGDSNSREGDSYGRDSDDRYGRDSYGDDYSRGRSHSVDGYRYGSRSRSADRDGDRAFDEDDRHSSRGSSVKATEDQNINGRRLERKFSEQNLGAPPSYEDAAGVSRSPTYSERDGETSAAAAAPLSPPAVGAAVPAQSSSPVTEATPQSSPAPNNGSPSQATTTEHGMSVHSNAQADSFDEFDPRGPVSAAPSTGHNAEMDLLGSLADAFSPGPLAIVPASSPTSDFESTSQASNPTYTVVPSENTVANQSFEDPFGDSPFKAIPSAQPHTFASTTSFQPAVTTLGTSNNSTDVSNIHSPPSQQFVSELQRNDVLAGILPPSGPFTPATQVPFSASDGQPSAGFGFMPQSAPPATSFHHMVAHNLPGQPDQLTRHNSVPFSAPSANSSSNTGLLASNKMPSHQNNDFLGGFLPQASVTSNSTGSLELVPHEPVEKKFETKSTVWADTLNRGLVNLNISGSKINPLSNIGVDFESLNRKEKRMEKPSTTAMTSTVSMGKAMGSGSGMGRAGAGALRPLSNPMMGSHIGSMGMSVGALPMGMGMGGAPMGMNMGMRPGVSMQRPQGSNTSNYPMMGRGGYPLQMYQYQYGGGYR